MKKFVKGGNVWSLRAFRSVNSMSGILSRSGRIPARRNAQAAPRGWMQPAQSSAMWRRALLARLCVRAFMMLLKWETLIVVHLLPCLWFCHLGAIIGSCDSCRSLDGELCGYFLVDLCWHWAGRCKCTLVQPCWGFSCAWPHDVICWRHSLTVWKRW